VNSVAFLHIDLDRQRDLAREMGVRAVPTFIAYRNGKEARVETGSRPGIVDSLLNSLHKP
jgi:thioredoxin-like negative regulator of GroEL